jgi:hypothetical protein
MRQWWLVIIIRGDSLVNVLFLTLSLSQVMDFPLKNINVGAFVGRVLD